MQEILRWLFQISGVIWQLTGHFTLEVLGTLQFAIGDHLITITENTITDQIANCRNRPISAIHDLKKNYTISQEKLYNFFVIANYRNRQLSANQDLKKNCTVFQEDYTVSRDCSLQKLAVLCN